jgi:dTDP-4-dehydrorhamnose 3,5-epimerase
MRFVDTPIPGVLVIEAEPRADERGYFARTFCAKEFGDHGLCTHWVQISTSFNKRRGTLRGMHFQAKPFGEVKLVRCTRGAIYDVALDLRPDSHSFRKWFAAELTADNGRMMYLPAGVAHGFQALADGSEVLYNIAEYYHAEAARGVRWDDPAFGIAWPIAHPILSPKDQAWPDFPWKN